ncbi:MAG: 3-oxoacyl-[acyl-carrier-protein] reductase [Caldisericum sp.]|uniref:3-oxoacyl-[acyl-carrier-protein] reductase n=1 Tax=Caldisericum exile TaxID=693075 RepID=A0A2J6WEJ8_9BACT|nr:MAG: 3-oxoacyl-[acyl-carrier-protein] reductase [Caldisericum exile]
MNLKNTVSVVTGGGRGIGRAISIALAKAGSSVSIIYTSRVDDALKTKSEIESFGGVAEIFQCNVVDEASSENAIRQIIDKFGRIDVLVNNAGITRDTLLLRMSVDDWDAVLDTNLKGAFLMTKHALKYMIKNNSGRIINIGSIVGITGNVGQANYVSSKAGLIGFTKAVALEYGSRGITSNLVAPGYIETEMTERLPQNVKETYLNKIVLKRAGKPEDIANVVVFLASPLASYITGSVIIVDGGLSLT